MSDLDPELVVTLEAEKAASEAKREGACDALLAWETKMTYNMMPRDARDAAILSGMLKARAAALDGFVEWEVNLRRVERATILR